MNKVNPTKPVSKNPDEEGEENLREIEGVYDPEEEIEDENKPEKIRENNFPPEEEN